MLQCKVKTGSQMFLSPNQDQRLHLEKLIRVGFILVHSKFRGVHFSLMEENYTLKKTIFAVCLKLVIFTLEG